jgi:hypothetical protein
MANSFQIETQEQHNWCWAAVAATVSNYFFPDRVLSQCAIVNGVLNIDCCQDGETSACDVPKALEDALDAAKGLLGTSLMHDTLDKDLEFETVRQKIDAGLPVCVRTLWYGDENRGHFVMIMGYSISELQEPWLDIADPYFEDSTVPYELFRSAYWGIGQWSNTCLVNQS